MNMNRRFVLSLSGILLLGICVPFWSVAREVFQPNGAIIEEEDEKPQETIEHVSQCGFSRPIRVATTVNNRPFGWAEWLPNQTVLTGKGYGIEMFIDIAQKLHLMYTIVGYSNDEEAIIDLKKGKLDLLIGLYAVDPSVEKNTATVYPAIFSNVFSVYYQKDRAFEFEDYTSLVGKKGVMRRSENIYPLFASRQLPVTLETTEHAFKKLLSGEADYLIGSPYSVEAELRRYKLHKDIISAPKAIAQAAMFMMLTKATDCFKLKDILGQEIEKYNQDPAKMDAKIRQVIDEWGERFREVSKEDLLNPKAPEEEQNNDVENDSEISMDVLQDN